MESAMLVARFDQEAVSIHAPGASTGLSLELQAWGIKDNLETLEKSIPQLGDCAPASGLDPQGQCIRQLEYRHDGLTAWWASVPEGLEQGWTVENPMEGTLVFETLVQGAQSISGEDNELRITDNEGQDWIVGAVSAWGADGTALPSRLRAEEDRIIVEVDTEGAAWPVNIDPVYAAAPGTITGSAASDFLGFSVSDAGDVNNDNFDDVIVSAFGYSLSTGRAYVYHGSNLGLATTATTTLTGTSASSRFGFDVAGAGDVNGDGYDDVVVGAYLYSSSTGQVFVYHGSSTGISSSATTTLTGAAAGYYFGHSVDSGDFNNDGYSDLVIGAYGYNSFQGRVYVYHGSSTGISTSASRTLTGGVVSDNYGYSVSNAGDVNGDGYADIVVGAYGYSSNTGRSYVYHGSSTGISSSAAITITGVALSEFGFSVSGAGDINGDGYDDLISSARGYSTNTGRALVYFGTSSGITNSATILEAEASADEYAYSVSGAGDVNNDGYDDVIVGARYNDGGGSNAGRAYIYHGSSSGLSTTVRTTLTGAAANDYFGTSVSRAGDINHDGYADVIVGAYGNDSGGSSAGRAYVYYGSNSTILGTGITPTSLTGAAAGDLFGYSVAGAGDVNHDGYDDVIVGAYLNDAAASNAGRAYIYHGSNNGLSTLATTTLSGGAASDSFGWSVAGAGDINGDTYDDVVIGAPGYSTNTGRVYVHHGSSAGISTIASRTLTGAATGDYFGYSVAGAGVSNAGSIDDIIVGAYGNDTSASNAGAAYIYNGASSGIPTTPSWTLYGTAANDNFGKSVAGLGDVNNDSYDDIIVGAPGYSSSTGRAYIYHGASLGISSVSTTLTGTTSADSFGNWVSPAGDVNNDGYVDVIIGAPNNDIAGSSAGAAYIYHGSGTGVSTTATTTLTGEATLDTFGEAVAAAGDVNGDGYDDILVSADENDAGGSSAGRAYVYQGSSSGISSSRKNSLTGAAASDYFGSSLAGAGDINNDGYADIIVSAYNNDAGGSNAGRAYVFYGYSEDMDGDGYPVATDCDDTDSADYPGATEIVGNGDDENCDGAETCYDDDDNDGYLDSTGDTRASTDTDCNDANEGTNSDLTTDCDDADSADYPGATETVGNGDDENCDGAETCYDDDDDDGYLDSTGDTRLSTDTDCTDAYEASNTDPTTDCDDADSNDHPGATETVGNGDDENCDGAETCYDDDDNDGYLDSAGDTRASTDTDCNDAYEGTTTDLTTDCDDSLASRSPGNTEICDASNVDEDCDSLADDNDTSVSANSRSTFYRDADGDSYGLSTSTVAACDQPTGYVNNSLDCSDSNAAINPRATEICDASNTDEDCDGLTDDNDSSVLSSTRSTWYQDSDADTYGNSSSSLSRCDQPANYVSNSTDCNDSSASINPAATEICDSSNVDEDCDGAADDNDASVSSATRSTFYLDSDGDTYGSTTTGNYCDRPSGYVTNNTDCNDSSATIYPGASEVCNGLDDNCNSQIDDNAVSLGTWYRDADSDGYGTSATTTLSCSQPVGYVSGAGDCNDSNASINPAATEICDASNTDEDCDNQADDNDSSVSAATRSTWYRDADTDSYGTLTTSLSRCDQPSGFVSTSSDCDDADSADYPGATEAIGNGDDENCDGAETCYDDDDNDGYLDSTGDTRASSDTDCNDANEGTTTDLTTDCDDADSADYPGATETIGNGDDESCDGTETCYDDDDNDGYLDSTADTRLSTDTDCLDANEGSHTDPTTDCNDSNSAINPLATEVCDATNTDEDCDGQSDDNDNSVSTATRSTFYSDRDGDSYGSSTSGSYCDQPNGYVSNSSDCNDNSSLINPGATEICDTANTDEDCDGLSDNADSSASTSTMTLWYPDADTDGYGNISSAGTRQCDASASYPYNTNTDCNDANSAINPGATEVCDATNTDEDCDGLADDADNSVMGASHSIFYRDIDGDGYGSTTTGLYCDQPTGYVSNSNDCNDNSAVINPAATEICDVGSTDEDCDGSSDDNDSSVNTATWSSWYQDLDRDGYGNAAISVSFCDQPSGYTANNTDCNDTLNAINPGATEICDSNNTDEDCDSLIDDSDTSVDTQTLFNWYADGDSDSFGDASVMLALCEQPANYVENATDCDDSDAAYYPGATEDCTDINDYNCDGSVGYVDNDGDGVAACNDCDDQDASINPNATEICDAFDTDENCDGLADNADATATNTITFYQDSDGDGYGSTTATSFCDQPIGYTANNTDCDDSNNAVNPAATEVCDNANVDEDCNGQSDNNDRNVSVSTQTPFYLDSDGDGYGSTSTEYNCDQPAGYVSNFEDCDDSIAAINPTATEICDVDNADEDCNGLADDEDPGIDTSTQRTTYTDGDGDGVGVSGTAVVSCDSSGAPMDGDCDDNNAAFYPGAAEDCADPNDYNCDGSVGLTDTDGDGVPACEDCDDQEAGVNPSATEICDAANTDENCDGLADDADPNVDVSTATVTFSDTDGDGYGDDASAVLACDGSGVAFGGDCNDNDSNYAPNAPEACADPNDYNCDGSVGTDDKDLDGAIACDDCNDNDASILPGAEELCDSVDNDCDGQVDIGATDADNWYNDADNDGYGDPNTRHQDCTQPANSVADQTDCDDSQSDVFPGAVEDCTDGLDTDCDGIADADEAECAEGSEHDSDSQPIVDSDTAVNDTDDGKGPTPTFCGCNSSGAPAAGVLLLGLAGLIRRRRA